MTSIEPDNMGEQISAYLDGELSDADRAAVEALIERDPAARHELERLRETTRLVADLPRRPAPIDLASDIMAAAANPNVAGKSQSPWRLFRSLTLLAAAVAIAATAGLWVLSQSPETESFDQVANSLDAKPQMEPAEADLTRRSVTFDLAQPTTPESAESPVAYSALTEIKNELEDSTQPAGRLAERVRASESATLGSRGLFSGAPQQRRMAKSAPPRSEVTIEITFADPTDFQSSSHKLTQYANRDRKLTSVDAMESLLRVDEVELESANLLERSVVISRAELPGLLDMFDEHRVRRDVTLTAADARAVGWSDAHAWLAMQSVPGIRLAQTGNEPMPATSRRGGIAGGFSGLQRMSVTVRLRYVEVAVDPGGRPGKLVPELTKDPKRP